MRELAHWAHSVLEFVCLSVCAIWCNFLGGLSLALISHEQFPGLSLIPPPSLLRPPSTSSLPWKLWNFETLKLGNLKTLKPKKCLWQKKNLLKKMWVAKKQRLAQQNICPKILFGYFFCIKKMLVKTIVGPKHNGENIFFCPKKNFFLARKNICQKYIFWQ